MEYDFCGEKLLPLHFLWWFSFVRETYTKVKAVDTKNSIIHFDNNKHAAIPYRPSTGPELGFFCEKYYTGKTLFSLQEWVCSEDNSLLNFKR